MVTTRKRALAAEVPASPKRPRQSASPPAATAAPVVATAGETPEAYEKSRDERIRENLERMQKLGIFDLSRQLTPRSSPSPNAVSRRASQRRETPVRKDKPPLPTRRSSRLQNVAPVSYSEIHVKRDEDSGKMGSLLIEEGKREEVYTDEHEKLLGTCETSWDLFVDGYDKDGKRIYDHIKGRTCHQCRQKTLGHRTQCIKCKLVQGQFCGDCLYMRYGENVVEANKNPNWVCPVCRGICNCSLCRIKKGWVPTGPLYKKILRLGYKSVAHYLIETRRSPENSGEPNSTQKISAKKSLPFPDEEDTSNTPHPLVSEDDINLKSHEKNSFVHIEKNGSTNSGRHPVSNDAEDYSHPGNSWNGEKLESHEEKNIGDCDEKTNVSSIDALIVGHAEEGSHKPESKSKNGSTNSGTHTVSNDAEDYSHPGNSWNGEKMESHEENIGDCDEKTKVNSIDALIGGPAEEGSQPGSKSKNGSTNSGTHTVSNDAEDYSHPGNSLNGEKLESHEENICGCDEKTKVNSIDALTVGHAEEGSHAKPGSNSINLKKPAATVNRSPDSIAGRLRSQIKKP